MTKRYHRLINNYLRNSVEDKIIIEAKEDESDSVQTVLKEPIN
jgi:hypothetical protein